MKKKILTYLFLFIVSCVSAEQKYVTINGSDSSNDGSVNSPWATLKYAVDHVAQGDTINLGVGTYTEQKILINKSITITGVNAKYSIIQAYETKPTSGLVGNVVFDIQANVSINRVTIRHGSPGINIGSAGNLNIVDCNILDCYTEISGAGIYSAGDIRMENCCVAFNTCHNSGAGIYASYTIENPARVAINNSTISHNQCIGNNSMGGGLFLSFASLDMKNSTVSYNSALSKGKGIHLNSRNAQVNIFYNNIIAGNGTPDVGAVYASIFQTGPNIDYNIISMAWANYLDFGSNTTINSTSDSAAIHSFIDSIAIQSIADAGTGVLAQAIDENSFLVLNKGGENATTTDLRGAPRTEPDIGAYEYVSNVPMTDLHFQNTDTIIFVSSPIRIAVKAIPAYTTESLSISLDSESRERAVLKGDTLEAIGPGQIKIWAGNTDQIGLKKYLIFTATDQIPVNSLSISLPSGYANVLPGGQLQFDSHVLPENTADKTVSWKTNSPELGIISQDGLFTAKAVGTVSIIATSNSNLAVSDTMQVEIVDDTPVDFSINTQNILKNSIYNPCGAVLCWLTDSDIERPRNRSMETALSKMRAGALRFPYGALSNNYIWTKNPDNTSNGLEPFVADPNRGPGHWEWAVDEQGFFKKDLDFDEYIELCRSIGAEPVVCVNIMSHVYNPNDDITIDTLIYYAKEWVRYANITKGYDIKHWQLGNEQDHHSDIYPLNEFKVHYKRMAEAMHAIDPNIKTAPGLLQNWNDHMLNYCPEYVNFITCHQYLWFGGNEYQGYDAWKNYGNQLIPHIKKNQDIVSRSANKNLEIFVTETGVTGGVYPDPQVFNLYKGLVLFEMQMEQIITPNVKHTFYWGTHTPWNGESGDSPIATLFSNDESNENHIQADVLAAINTHIQTKFVGKSTKHGITSYTTLSSNDSLMVVFALNKNRVPKRIKLGALNNDSIQNFETWAFAGTSEYDNDVSFKMLSRGKLDDSYLIADLPPLSISILRMKMDGNGGSNSVEKERIKNKIKIFPNPVRDELNIEFTRVPGKDVVLTITNLSGQTCIKRRLQNNSKINVSDLQAGLYLLSCQDRKGSYVSFFIKE